MIPANFDKIFKPKTVAVIGVSRSEGFSFGRAILSALLNIGFKGKLYPVNPEGGTIFGIDICPTIADIPEQLDFAIITLPAAHVTAALDECRKKGAAAAEIISAGFRETGTPEGIKLEEDVRDAASRGIRVVGPNCFGIYCPESGLTLVPGPHLSRKPGNVAFISQSGGMSIDFTLSGMCRGIYFSKVISFGNGADLRETELLRYLGDDPETGIICMYIEGITDGREFFDVLKNVSLKKPVIILKGGLSDAGSRAVTSHTASMSGNRVVWESMMRQCGALQVFDLDEMIDLCASLLHLPHREYRGISIVGGGGAIGVTAADLAEDYGMVIPQLDPGIQEQILKHLPQPGSSATNPVDVANPFVQPSSLRKVLTLAARDRNVDIQLLVQLLYHYKSLAQFFSLPSIRDLIPYNDLADITEESIRSTGKPVVLVLPNYLRGADFMDIEEVIQETRKHFAERSLPVYDSVKSAVIALGRASGWFARRLNSIRI